MLISSLCECNLVWIFYLSSPYKVSFLNFLWPCTRVIARFCPWKGATKSYNQFYCYFSSFFIKFLRSFSFFLLTLWFSWWGKCHNLPKRACSPQPSAERKMAIIVKAMRRRQQDWELVATTLYYYQDFCFSSSHQWNTGRSKVNSYNIGQASALVCQSRDKLLFAF